MGKEGWMYEKKIRGRWEWGRSGKWGHAEGDESEWTVWTRVWVYVSLPERLSYWTGSTPYQVTHLKLKMLGSEKEEERRHCSLLCNQERVAPFFCPHHPMWANELRWVSQLIKAPCQPGMHYVETGKLLKAFQWSMMFYGAPWPAESNLKKISSKMKGGPNPIKAGQPSPKPEQVLQYPCHYCMCGPPEGLRFQRQSLPAGW